MVRIAPIKLQYSPKTLWFDANELEIDKGDAVVVTTARGVEFGYAANEVFEAEDEEVKKLKTELKPVERLATPEDVEKAQEMQEQSNAALPIFKEMAAETSEDMHPVSVEFLLDGDKAIFYFEAEERIDFRELVRKLAAKFHVRIDMRQIGVRDEARIIGGLGHCGQELCCKRLGGEFSPVSIRMAKEQDLSLNPQKISGVCGRLMCCLRYEFDAYKDFKDRAPKINAKIETPEGTAKVVDLNVPREIVTLQLEDDKRVKIPLDEMETPEKGSRPSKVSKQAFERFANQNIFDTFDLIALPHFGDSPLSSSDSPSSNQKRTRKDQSRRGSKNEQATETARKPRRRTRMNKDGQAETEQMPAEKKNQSGQNKKRPNQKRRRQEGSSSKNQGGAQKGTQKNANKQRQDKSAPAKSGPRPGQKSSGLRNKAGDPASSQQSRTATSRPSRDSGNAIGQRKTRRRSHTSGSDSSGGSDES